MDIVKRIDTPYNNAVAILNRVNELLNENNIMDSTGNEIARMEQNVANPAWLFALACGQLHTSWQEQLAKAYSALDPQNCEDDQVLVLASLAGIQRGNGTPSHITVLIINTSASGVQVPIGTTFTETYANQTWVMNKTVTIGAGGQQYVTLFTTTDGEYNVPSGLTFSYSGNLPIVCESTSESTGGSNIETISSLRNRISQGEDTSNFITQTKTAIEFLSGIESCSIWFNSDSVNNLVIGQGSASRVTVAISNTSNLALEVPAGTSFTDNSANKSWVLKNKITIAGQSQKNATLYSVLGEDISINSGTTFTYSGELTITCTSVANSIVGSITIPPRNAYLSLKGYDYSGKVAETYYAYMNVPATVGSQQEKYLLGQQELTVNFDYTQEITVKIYVTMKASDMAVGAEGAVKNAIMAHSGTLACGEDVTSQIVSEWVQNLGYGTIIDCSVGTPTGMMSNISPTEYCVFDNDNIIVSSI
jgi:hypothetical protein